MIEKFFHVLIQFLRSRIGREESLSWYHFYLKILKQAFVQAETWTSNWPTILTWSALMIGVSNCFSVCLMVVGLHELWRPVYPHVYLKFLKLAVALCMSR